MSIFGHDRVLVEKDTVQRRWVVKTLQGAELLTVPWSDTFKSFPHHKDYQEAITTCQSDADTCLTPAETRDVLAPAPAAALALPAGTLPPISNVLRVDFKRKKRV